MAESHIVEDEALFCGASCVLCQSGTDLAGTRLARGEPSERRVLDSIPVRRHKLTRSKSVMSEYLAVPNVTVFGDKLATSQAFKDLFREGMLLVEETASYLDGNGREDSRALDRGAALSYATESMRLTTRLMQLASWLLLQRAVNEGELSLEEAAEDKAKVRLSSVGVATPEATLFELPQGLQDLIGKAMALQNRIIHFDTLIYSRFVGTQDAAPADRAPLGLAAQMSRLHEAFSIH
jgi:regulator of CtrA degradation